MLGIFFYHAVAFAATCSKNIFRPGTVGSLFGSEEDVFCSVARSMCPDSVLVIIRLGSRPLVFRPPQVLSLPRPVLILQDPIQWPEDIPF